MKEWRDAGADLNMDSTFHNDFLSHRSRWHVGKISSPFHLHVLFYFYYIFLNSHTHITEQW